jgi:hypothetical protein
MSAPNRSTGGGTPPARRAAKTTGEGALPPSVDESPGLPGFRTWRGVYLCVLGVFALVVAGLTLFTRIFS